MTKGLEELTPQELLDFMRLSKTLEGIDLEKLEADRLAKLSPREALVAKAKAGGTLSRIVKAKGATRGPGRPRVHWKTKAKRYREYHRKYQLDRYHEVVKPRRKAEAVKLLEGGRWYPYLMRSWKQRKVKVKLTENEWEMNIRPLVGDSVPVIIRYDSREPISLYNIVVKDTATRACLYDGKEQEMKDKGYTV